MKCQHCHAQFEPTPEEERILRSSPCTYIPFCCESCYRQYHGISIYRKNLSNSAMMWHNGEKTTVKYGGRNSDGFVRQITSADLLLAEKYRGRSWLDYEDAEIPESLLPSEEVFGKCYWHH